MDYMDGGDWGWMFVVMPIFIIAVGAVVYAAVRLANRDSQRHQ